MGLVGCGRVNGIVLGIVITVCCCGKPCMAAVKRVHSASEGPVHDGTSWDTAFQTIQSALDAASPGDEIWVAEGLYAENVRLRNGLGLYGGFAGTETDRTQREPASHPSIIDGGETAPTVSVGADVVQEAVIDGFEIRRGGFVMENSSGYGGGIYVHVGKVAIRGNTVTQNTIGGDVSGGGIYVRSGSAVIEGNKVTANASPGIIVTGSTVKITRNTITGNGFGISLGSATVVINDNLIADNSASGIFGFDQGTASYTIAGNTIRRNRLGIYLWGAMDNHRTTTVLIEGNTVSDNSNLDETDLRTAGIQCLKSTAVIRNNIITGNTLRSTPANAKSGVGLRVYDTVRIEGNLIANNTLEGPGNGSAIAGLGGSVEIVGNTIAGNNGGENAVFTANPGQFANNIVAFNSSGVEMAGTFRNNNVFGNAAYQYRNADPTGTDGNISADPHFLDIAGGNYRLESESPCIDAGNATSVKAIRDRDGRPRTLDGDGDGTAMVDIGAFEYGVLPPFTLADAVECLRITAGLHDAGPDEVRLNIESPFTTGIDAQDTLRVARKAASVDP